MPTKSRIAVVGGGCSGVLVAAQLLRHGYRGEIAIVEPRRELGRGLAYSTACDQHMMNVPAAKVSAWPDDPGHYVDWLCARGWPAADGAFTPRRLYGEYLEDVLHAEASRAGARGEIRHICAEAAEIKPRESSAQVLLQDGHIVEAEKVVLAPGNPASSPALHVPSTDLEALVQPSPWLDDALSLRFPSERVLLLGTGLTAIDAMLALLSQDENAQVIMASRRGMLPRVHTNCRPAPEFSPLSAQRGLPSMVRELMGRISAMNEMGLCWRAAIDALRPHADRIWSELTLDDQRRFLRHLKAYWEPHRHRMAPEAGERVRGYLASGRLEALAGRVVKIAPGPASILVHLINRAGDEQAIRVDRVINCTGIHENYANSPRPLIRSLISTGVATANALHLGFRTDSHGALLDRNMQASKLLFTLGPPRRGELFETTAIPEIRKQAEALARHLIAS
jgi:uncharacterized NAD(P)/FAD-binding protein YdhS